MSRLRLAAHRLSIETGRWAKPNPIPVNERRCIVCNVLEDEYHFFLECSLYNDLRNAFILQYYRRRPNMQKFIDLLTCENEDIIKNLCMFVYKASITRSNNLYVVNV